jgi:EGF-like domain
MASVSGKARDCDRILITEWRCCSLMMQLSDNGQSTMPVSATVGYPKDVVFSPANAKSQHRLVAFTNNGQLLNRDFGVDVRIVSVDTANTATPSVIFQYKLDFLPTYSAEVTAVLNSAYSSRATAYHLRPDTNMDNVAENSGVYVYWNFMGSDFDQVNPTLYAGDSYFFNVTYNEGVRMVNSDGSTAHAKIECAGRGACDRGTGECKCFAGYTGDACQRTTCPNDCSGHGTCMSLQTLVEEGSAGALAYTAFDAGMQYGCKCDAGFRGHDCSLMECPSGPDPLGGAGGAEGRDCSSRGECDYTTGSCKCHKGFGGELNES